MSAPASRPDASMDLLRQITAEAVDPGYAEASRQPRQRHRVALAVTLLVAGLLLGLAAGQTTRAAPAASAEREQLIALVRQSEASQDALRARLGELERSTTDLEGRLAGLDPATEARGRELAAQTGLSAVSGPGLVLTLDDGPDAAQSGSTVVDADLRVAVNGLWAAGAEAVAINGHRLSSRTAIRNAGDAVTVDYRSLTRPYVVRAIGDPAGLESGFAGSGAGAWWRALASEYGMRYTVARSASLTLVADPGLGVDVARSGKE